MAIIISEMLIKTIFVIVFKDISDVIMFLVDVDYASMTCKKQKTKKKRGQGENSAIHICDFH